MLVYLFRDKSSTDAFAISTDVTGQNIPPLSPLTEWTFVVAAIDPLKLVEQWEVGDFQDVRSPGGGQVLPFRRWAEAPSIVSKVLAQLPRLETQILGISGC